MDAVELAGSAAFNRVREALRSAPGDRTPVHDEDGFETRLLPIRKTPFSATAFVVDAEAIAHP